MLSMYALLQLNVAIYVLIVYICSCVKTKWLPYACFVLPSVKHDTIYKMTVHRILSHLDQAFYMHTCSIMEQFLSVECIRRLKCTFQSHLFISITHTVFRSKSPRGKYTKLHSVAASTNRNHMPWSLLLLPLVSTINYSPDSQAIGYYKSLTDTNLSQWFLTFSLPCRP